MDPNTPQPAVPQQPAPNQVPISPTPQPAIVQPQQITPDIVALPQPAVPQQPLSAPIEQPALPVQPAIPTVGVTAPQPATPVVQPAATALPQQPVMPMQQVASVPQTPGIMQPGVAPSPVLPAQPIGQNAGSPKVSPRSKNKVLMIATVVITVAAIGLSSYGAVHVFLVRKNKYGFAADAAKQKKEKTQKAIEASKPEKEKRNDGKLNVSKLFSGDDAQRQQDISAELDEQINIANGFSFMVTDVEKGWTKSSEYATPAGPGKEFIKVEVHIGSRAEAGTITISSYDFKLVNSKNGKQDAAYISDKDLPDNPLANSVNLNPGDEVTAWVVFEVTKGESPISLLYEEKGYSCPGSDNKDCVMKGTVKIQ